MLVYMVIAGLVLGSVYRVLMRQGRGYARQMASIDVDESTRNAGGVLAWDIRHAGMAGDQLRVPLSADSITLLSVQGVGVVCQKHATLPRYAIWKTGGSIDATVNDSAMVYSVSNAAWHQARITGVNTGSFYGMTACAWSGGRAPDLVVELNGVTGDTAGIGVGSPFRAWRKVTYKAMTESGRTWLGRRVGDNGTYEKLTGPLKASGGLVFTYYDINGAATAVPTDVRLVKFTVLSESYKQYRDASGTSVYRYDSVSTAVALRR